MEGEIFWEVAPILRSYNKNITANHCLGTSEVKYRLRRNQDDVLICEMDKDLNIIGGFKCLYSLSDYEKVMKNLNEYKVIVDEVDDWFDKAKKEYETNKKDSAKG